MVEGHSASIVSKRKTDPVEEVELDVFQIWLRKDPLEEGELDAKMELERK